MSTEPTALDGREAVGSPADAYEQIRRAALLAIERRRLRPEVDHDAMRAEIDAAVDAYQRQARLGLDMPLGDPGAMARRVLRSLVDFGPLTELVTDPGVEEIFVEGARVTYLDAHGRLRGLAEPTSERENRQIVERLLAGSDRVLNASTPTVQARVLGGSARLTAALPPVADRLSATLRRYTVRDVGLADLVARGSLERPAAAFLHAVMQTRSRIVVSGEPGAGKTTLLSALLAAVPVQHCVRGCEEVRELAVPLAHGSYYEARPAALDGTGEISLRALLKFTLAMRPDVIVVGEVRGAEAFELTRALNAGCGFLGTVHANCARDALSALVNAALMAGENVTEGVVRAVFSQAIDLVVHTERDARPVGGGAPRRRVREIVAVTPSLTDDFTVEPLFVRAGPDGPLRWTGALPERLAERVERSTPAGASLRDLLGDGRQA